MKYIPWQTVTHFTKGEIVRDAETCYFAKLVGVKKKNKDGELCNCKRNLNSERNWNCR